MTEPIVKRKVGRPKTGRVLARYFVLQSVAARIAEEANKRKLKRPADELERAYGQ